MQHSAPLIPPRGQSIARILVLILFTAATAFANDLEPVPGDARPDDRDAIRAHIDSIFRAFIAKDHAKVRATHADDWRGFLTRTGSIIQGLDAYMQEAGRALDSPGGMTDYRMKEFDVLFYGDIALVPYVAEMFIGPPEKGFTASLRVLDVYAPLNGHWIQIASNTSLHPDSQADFRRYPNPNANARRRGLLEAREAVWRAWFSHDRETLTDVLPEKETLAIQARREAWDGREQILAGAEAFAESGARLVRLEFPRTEIQMYGDLAVLYTLYEYEIEKDGERRIQSGRGTEIFIQREGRWVNVGWHLDSGHHNDGG